MNSIRENESVRKAFSSVQTLGCVYVYRAGRTEGCRQLFSNGESGLNAASWRKDDPQIWNFSSGTSCWFRTNKILFFLERKPKDFLSLHLKKKVGKLNKKGRKKVDRTNVKNVRSPGTASSISPHPTTWCPPLFSPFWHLNAVFSAEISEEKNRGHFLCPRRARTLTKHASV